ncbi:hypothetical protein [Alloyangia mangrovi]|uniref:hypothetical protein n=1 Tax=Alloyangia mangrovi TaxID=1779329 RepID=UPI0035D4E128
MDSLERLRRRHWSKLHPGHGAPVEAPLERIDALLAHRRAREAAILAALAAGPADAASLASVIYHDTNPALLPAAARNVLAHLIDLTQRKAVIPLGNLEKNLRLFKVLKENSRRSEKNCKKPLDARSRHC